MTVITPLLLMMLCNPVSAFHASPSADCSTSNRDFSRRAFLEFPIALGVSTAFYPAKLQQAVADSSVSPVPPSVPSSTNVGVLWRTTGGKALPANAATVLNMVKTEILGPVQDTSLPNEGIICVSERHDDFEHHLVQLRVVKTILKALNERSNQSGSGSGSRNSKLAIGMECFQRKDQVYLDRFVASGDTGVYTLSDLRRDTDWDSNWGYDMLHYVPILSFAQQKGVHLLGLHPSNDLTDTVTRKGLAGMPDSIIHGVSTKEKEHWERFRERTLDTMSLEEFGGCEEALNARIARLYEIQCFREEYMAESVALHMSQQRGRWMAVFAGENHVLGRDGIPFRALRRMTARMAAKNPHSYSSGSQKPTFPAVSNRGVFTIVPRTTSFPIVAKEAPGMGLADYVWFVERDPAIEFDESVVNTAPRRLTKRA